MLKAAVGVVVISGVVALASFFAQDSRDQDTSDQGRSRDNPVRVGGDVREPVRLRNVIPSYPPGTSLGQIVLELTVSPKGNVEAVKVVRPLEGATDVAVDAAAGWVYEPMIRNGEPVWFVLVAVLSNPPKG